MWAEYVQTGRSAPAKSPRSRRFHRVVATIFTATVAANFIAMIFGPPPAIITYAPLPPLLVLMVTGVIMLVAGRRHIAGAGR